jgi:hypothetical protein
VQRGKRHLAATAAVLAALACAPAALAHVERTSYFPDPAPDGSITPAAGGAVPEQRPLASALKKGQAGVTRVVCKGKLFKPGKGDVAKRKARAKRFLAKKGRKGSLNRALKSIKSARKKGFVHRPSQPRQKLGKKRARNLSAINRRLRLRCGFNHIQPAVQASGNNDRVVVMPGLYMEEPSRAMPENDPKCEGLEETSENGAGAASYRYQFTCPNDQSLIYIGGRSPGPGEDPPPQADRTGIPNLGPCLRCNFQLEGSGAKPSDVIIEAGNPKQGNSLPAGDHSASPDVKDVVIRADRADGLVLSNFIVRHADEHGIYVHETDGYLLDRVNSYYNLAYGYLTFTSDHGVTRDCDTAGNGDSGLYPGAGPDTGEQTEEAVQRLNQKLTRCDSHHNTLGYSGTMGNATHVIDNEIYDNATGIATDSFFAGGHPGFPQDSARFENNRIYDNNFNPYTYQTDVEPLVPLPVGTGILIAGGNGNRVVGNQIYDNWRRGTMLVAVPDTLSEGSGSSGFSTSFRNQYSGNTMGIAPSGQRDPNGVDFFWDEFPVPGGGGLSSENCWFGNQGSPITSDPILLPSDCSLSFGNPVAYATKAPVLAECAMWERGQTAGEFAACDWFTTPPEPGTRAADRFRAAERRHGRELAQQGYAAPVCELLKETFSCEGFDRPSSP